MLNWMKLLRNIFHNGKRDTVLFMISEDEVKDAKKDMISLIENVVCKNFYVIFSPLSTTALRQLWIFIV